MLFVMMGGVSPQRGERGMLGGFLESVLVTLAVLIHPELDNYCQETMT